MYPECSLRCECRSPFYSILRPSSHAHHYRIMNLLCVRRLRNDCAAQLPTFLGHQYPKVSLPFLHLLHPHTLGSFHLAPSRTDIGVARSLGSHRDGGVSVHGTAEQGPRLRYCRRRRRTRRGSAGRGRRGSFGDGMVSDSLSARTLKERNTHNNSQGRGWLCGGVSYVCFCFWFGG